MAVPPLPSGKLPLGDNTLIPEELQNSDPLDVDSHPVSDVDLDPSGLRHPSPDPKLLVDDTSDGDTGYLSEILNPENILHPRFQRG
ncbi:hypothetical protein NDU88_005738 [Pleurodeles waltl]|uniref:Uncharacterized protein n=1 Tax=Pleurodeles waltl TaxID=8319 RepID=A0AAV7TBI5_PLEWA|nr:hypothetical protein NDU88_005738 [Pleurodeles waltl]